MRIYFVRHGEPCYNPDSLTNLGHQQAEEVANFFKNIKIDKIFASNSNRAYQTASHTALAVNLPITQRKWMNEGLAGASLALPDSKGDNRWFYWNDKFLDTLKSLKGDHDWLKENLFPEICINGVNRLRNEVDNFYLELNIKHNREDNTFTSIGPNLNTICVFAHGGMGMITVPNLAGINETDFFDDYGGLNYCGIAIIDIDLEKNHKAALKEYDLIVYKEQAAINEIKN